jgi:predicted transcriptional regulator
MATRRLRPDDRAFLKRLGKKIEKIVLEERGYSSLDAFSLECHDLIAKPTLYQICQGKRDMKISTLRGLAAALDVSIQDLIAGA